jgi:hypothetical protein
VTAISIEMVSPMNTGFGGVHAVHPKERQRRPLDDAGTVE